MSAKKNAIDALNQPRIPYLVGESTSSLLYYVANNHLSGLVGDKWEVQYYDSSKTPDSGSTYTVDSINQDDPSGTPDYIYGGKAVYLASNVAVNDGSYYIGTEGVNDFIKIKPTGFITPLTYGAIVNDPLYDSQSACQSAIDRSQEDLDPQLNLPTGILYSSPLTSNRPLTIKGEGGSPFNSKSRLSAFGNQTHVLKIGDLQNNGVSPAGGAFPKYTFKGFGIIGNTRTDSSGSPVTPHTITDALLIIEQAVEIAFEDMYFGDVYGRLIRARAFFDSWFSRCQFFNGGVPDDSAIYIDEIAYNNGLYNTNNINFNTCRFESLTGAYIKSHPNSNIDVLRIRDSKFEHGSEWNGGNTTKTAIFELENANRVSILDGHFTNFRKNFGNDPATDDISVLLELKDTEVLEFKRNEFSQCDLDIEIDANCSNIDIAENYGLFGNSEVRLASCEAKGRVRFEPLIGDKEGPRNKQNSTSQMYFSRDFSWKQNEGFVSDPTSNTVEGLVFSAEAGAILGQVSFREYQNYRNDVAIHVRLKSSAANGSVICQGKPNETIYKTFTGIGLNFDFYTFVIPQSVLAGTGTDDGIRFINSSASDTVYIDQIIIVPLETRSATFSEISDINDEVNLRGKYTGRVVYDTTNDRLVVANGDDAASTWSPHVVGVVVNPS